MGGAPRPTSCGRERGRSSSPNRKPALHALSARGIQRRTLAFVSSAGCRLPSGTPAGCANAIKPWRAWASSSKAAGRGITPISAGLSGHCRDRDIAPAAASCGVFLGGAVGGKSVRA